MSKSSDLPPALILAGGRGSRLGRLTDEVPKPMVSIGNVPFLELVLRELAVQGCESVVLSVGYLADAIIQYFERREDIGTTLEFSVESTPMGTGGALMKASRLLPEAFFVLNGDTFPLVSLKELCGIFREKRAEAVLTIKLDESPSAANTRVETDGRISIYDKTMRRKGLNGIDAGASLFSKSVFTDWTDRPCSLEMELLPKLVDRGTVFGFLTHEPIYDIGTREGLRSFREFFLHRGARSGKARA